MNIEFRQNLIDMYLDWVNNFLTVERYAEYYGITEVFAAAVIKEGRELHEARVSLAEAKEKFRVSRLKESSDG